MIRVVFLIVSLIAAPVAAQESPPPAAKDAQQPQFSENVEVVAVTPIHGLGVPKSKVAANVQVIVPPAVPALAPSDTARLLAERATSVTRHRFAGGHVSTRHAVPWLHGFAAARVV